MARHGASQLIRRLLATMLFTTALISIGVAPLWWGVVLILSGGLIYGVWPSPHRQDGDLVLRPGPAVIGPDFLGFSLTAFFVALPIWIGRGEATVGLHGSASMLWIMAAGSAVLLWVGASASCFRLRIDLDGLTLVRLGGKTVLRWPELIGWQRWHRGLPGVLRKLAPFFPPGPAGSILLARDSTGVELHLTDGRIFRVPHEGFEHGEARLLKALAEHGVQHLSARGTG